MNRAHISHRTKEAIIARQADLCPMCGKLLVGVIHFDHEIALAIGGADDESNLRAVHADCHSVKTKDDIKRAAKTKRQAGITGQWARRQRNGPQIKSRGFQTTLRRKMNGTIEVRSKP